MQTQAYNTWEVRLHIFQSPFSKKKSKLHNKFSIMNCSNEYFPESSTDELLVSVTHSLTHDTINNPNFLHCDLVYIE